MPIDKQMQAELLVHDFMSTLNEIIELGKKPDTNLHIWQNVPHLIKTHELLGRFIDLMTEQRVLDLQQEKVV